MRALFYKAAYAHLPGTALFIRENGLKMLALALKYFFPSLHIPSLFHLLVGLFLCERPKTAMLIIAKKQYIRNFHPSPCEKNN